MSTTDPVRGEAVASPSGPYEAIGQLIRAARLNAGLTQEALASQLGLTRTSITNIEVGRQRIQVHMLLDIAARLGVPPASLLPRPGATPSWRVLSELHDYTEREQAWIAGVFTPPSESTAS